MVNKLLRVLAFVITSPVTVPIGLLLALIAAVLYVGMFVISLAVECVLFAFTGEWKWKEPIRNFKEWDGWA